MKVRNGNSISNFTKQKPKMLWEFRTRKIARPVIVGFVEVGEDLFPGGWIVSDYI